MGCAVFGLWLGLRVRCGVRSHAVGDFMFGFVFALKGEEQPTT